MNYFVISMTPNCHSEEQKIFAKRLEEISPCVERTNELKGQVT